jgi:hypothetical protein
MKAILKFAALLVALATMLVWTWTGRNRGFTKTTGMVTSVDPVTEQEIIRWERRFQAGVDFLGGGLAAGLALFTLSVLIPDKPRSPRDSK